MASIGMSNGGAAGQYITLVSNDDYEFVVLREAAMVSGTIKRMITGGFQEAVTGICRFEDISGIVLEKVAEYLHYNYQYRDAEEVPDMDIPPELCLELLMAADFLDT